MMLQLENGGNAIDRRVRVHVRNGQYFVSGQCFVTNYIFRSSSRKKYVFDF